MSKMTKTLIITVTLIITAFFGIQQAQAVVAPGVAFDGGAKGGLNAPLSSDILVDTFGRIQSASQAEWDHAGGVATPTADGADILYHATLTGPGSDQALPTTEDWVATITWTRNDLGAASHRVWVLKNGGGSRLFDFQGQGTGNVRLYHNGVIPDGFGDFPVSAGTHKLTVHYIADEGDFDFWIDDSKVIDGIASELSGGLSTALDFESMLLRSQNGGPHTSRDQYSLAQAGQLLVLPEPSTLTIVGLGGLIMWSRRRFNRA